jgi:hypothetical protein
MTLEELGELFQDIHSELVWVREILARAFPDHTFPAEEDD